MDDVSLEDLNPKKIAEDMLMSNYDTMIDLYRWEDLETDFDLSDEERDEIVDDENVDETERFKNWLEGYVEARYNNAFNTISNESTFENGRIKIWREMTVDENYVKHLLAQGKHLGIFWSFTKDAAEAHWGHGDKNIYVKIETSIPENHVNWEETILLNMSPNIGDEEKEIRLFKGTPIHIETMSIADDGFRGNMKPVDITPFKDKTFLA